MIPFTILVARGTVSISSWSDEDIQSLDLLLDFFFFLYFLLFLLDFSDI